MRKVYLIIITLLSIACFSCKKTYCPAFPAELNYYPYLTGQEIRFSNSLHEIQSFIISKKENSKAYSFDWNCKCECNLYTIFHANSNQNSFNIRCEMLIVGYTNPSSIYIENRFGSDSFVKSITPSSVSYGEVGKFLDETIYFENENNKIIKKMVISKNKGIVSYTTADGEEWNLVD